MATARRDGTEAAVCRDVFQPNSNWKNTKDVAEFSELCPIAEGSSMHFIQDPFYLHSKGSPEEKNQQEAKSQDSLSEFSTKLLSFHEPNAVVSNEPFRLHTKGRGPAENCHCEERSRMHEGVFPLRIQGGQPQRLKKDFVASNKRTLGLRSEINSYLQLHTKKQEALQKQIHPVKSYQRNNIQSNQRLKERAIPRNDSQQQPGRPAELRPWHHQIPGSQTSPSQAVEQEDSSTLQECLYPSRSVGPNPNTAANSGTCLINSPSSRHLINQDFTTFNYPSHPKSHTFNPAEVISPAYTSKEDCKYQHSCPNGFPRGQQHLHNHATVQLFARDYSTNGQAHPNQRNISSTFNASFQELVKGQESLQDGKGHVCVDKRLPQSSIHSSPTSPCTTSQFAPMMERYHQKDTHLTEAHLVDRHFCGLLPPINPQLESVSEVDPKGVKGNQVKKPQSNSEAYFIQMEKQNQPKVRKKPCTSKAYINLNVKLGGLGPDYEAIKEKKEKLKQQKEYAKQIKERNMKSIALVQRLPTKPQVATSVPRQKALEYAKKIPRPKTLTAKQSTEKVKEERVLPQTLNGDILPQIASLEILQERHQKEKQVVAAFKNLHILQVF